jgi:hypothetical protein
VITHSFACNCCHGCIPSNVRDGLMGVSVKYVGPVGDEKSRWERTSDDTNASVHFCFSCFQGMKSLAESKR